MLPEIKIEKGFKKISELSVFFPVYNEEENIKQTLERCVKILPQIAKKYEVLVINDGSTDRTAQIVEAFIKLHPEIRMITITPNAGYGKALRTAFYNTKYDWVTFTDSDGQFDFSEITKFITTQRETKADLVVGWYKKRAVSLSRKINTWMWQKFVWLLFGLNIRDFDCGFKLINKRVIEMIPRLESGRGAFISSEFLIKAKKSGFKIVEIGVHHYPRTAGKGTGSDLRVIISSFIDLFKLWMKLK